jgi:cytidine deaminase
LSDSEQRKPGPRADRRADPNRRIAARRKGSDSRATDPPGGTADRRGRTERRGADRRTGRDPRSEAEWRTLSIDSTSPADVAREAVLLRAAAEARTRAHARYSHFMVGAALETPDGEIVGGCNIENATYGLTICAERVALVKALSDGRAVFTRIAIVADTEAPTPPCGPCRQLLWEYCGDIDIILGNLNGPTGRFRLSALLPLPFDSRLLG